MVYSSRILIVYTVIALVFSVAILGRFGQLMLSQDARGSTRPVAPPKVVRGSIFDRNGKLLANQVKRHSLEAWLPSVRQPERSAEIIGAILGIKPAKLYQRLQNAKRKYMWVRRFLIESQAEKLREQIAKGLLPGFRLREEYKRYYPLGELASHLIGFTNIDNVGLEGVERSLESVLNPPPSERETSKSGSFGLNIIYGDKVYLSIDIDTQYIIDKIARKSMAENQADYLVALLMDARSGALLAFVSLPEYDPNLFNRYPRAILNNQAISTAYEPGSVFKFFTMAALLDEKIFEVDHIFDIGMQYNPPVFQRYNIQPINDVAQHAALSTTELLIYSSNVGMATASEGISKKRLYERLQMFGFGKKTGIPLPGESNGLLKHHSKWTIRTKPTIVFGQEIGISSIQMARAATVFANSGMLLAPLIIDRIEAPSGKTKLKNRRQPQYEVISPITARNMLMMSEQVIASDLGTMRSARVAGLRISGKSGTAQVIDPKTGSYYPERVNSSAMAIFPTDEPQFILFITIFNPKKSVRWGGRIVSPMVAEVISELTTRYNLPLKGNRIAYFNEDVQNLIKTKLTAEQNLNLPGILQELPELRGLSKRKLLPLLRIPGLSVEVIGEGHVVRQSQPPGTPIPDSTADAPNANQNLILPLKIWLE